MIAPTPHRITLVVLLVAALAAALLAFGFLGTWNRHVEGLEPDVFRGQGLEWGVYFQKDLERRLEEFLARPSTRDWEREFPLQVGIDYRQGTARPRVEATELSLLAADDGSEPLAVLLGAKLAEFADDGFEYERLSGLNVRVDTDEDGGHVYVVGPVRGSSIGGEKSEALFRFRLALRFPPLRIITAESRRYAQILLLLYLLMLYGILIAVYVAGRRGVMARYRAKEKEIRLNAVGAVAEGIAHEVRNPLNAVSLLIQYVERLREKSGKHPAPEDFQRLYLELGKIRKVIDNFVGFAKLRDLELSDWNFGEAVAEAVSSLENVATGAGATISIECLGNLELHGDRPKMLQVIRSVVENAIEAVGNAEERTIRVAADGRKDMIRFAIRDPGESPSEKVLQNMFDPYFTTHRQAMGLGLTLAKTIVESHGGTIEAASPEGGGCVVTMRLPRRF